MQRVLLTALIVGCALTFGGLAIAQAADQLPSGKAKGSSLDIGQSPASISGQKLRLSACYL